MVRVSCVYLVVLAALVLGDLITAKFAHIVSNCRPLLEGGFTSRPELPGKP